MRRALLLPLLAAALCADAGAAASPAPRSGALDAQVAVVNGKAILYSDVVREMLPFAERLRSRPDAPQDPDALFRAAFRLALDEAENRALVLAKYEEGEMRMPEHAIDRFAAEILQTRYNGNLQELQKELSARNQTYAEWRSRQEESMIVAAMRQMFVNGNASVSPNEIAQAYEARKAEFARPARMHLRIVSVPAADTNAVAAFSSRLAAGEGFAAVAADLAPGQDGDYGFVGGDNALAPLFMDAAAPLADGAAAGPLELAGKAYFVHRIESEAAATVPLAEAWDSLREELLAAKREELYKTWTSRLRAAASIRETLPWSE
jgi:parvulin-like peptidyl-prolyl isomerase